jgi:hypothetical protein
MQRSRPRAHATEPSLLLRSVVTVGIPVLSELVSCGLRAGSYLGESINAGLDHQGWSWSGVWPFRAN